jgi:hypothetical protein
MSGYKEICQWINHHHMGRMDDWQQGMMLIGSYLPQEHNRLSTLSSDLSLYDTLLKYISDSNFIESEPQEQSRKVNIVVESGYAAPAKKIHSTSSKLILKQQGYLHATMRNIGRDTLGRPLNLSAEQLTQRKSIIAELVALEQDLIKGWQDAAHMEKFGTLPAPSPAIDAKTFKPITGYQEAEANRKLIGYYKREITSREKKLYQLTGDKLDSQLAKLAEQRASLVQIEKIRETWLADPTKH